MQTINNGETGSSVRGKLNANFTEALSIKSNDLLSLAKRKGDVLYGIIDQYTGENFTMSKVTGTPTVDGIIYFQLGAEYFKRNFTKINAQWFGALPNGSDCTAAVQSAANSLIGIGGEVNFPIGAYFIPGKISIVNDLATPPRQAPIKFTGEGALMSGRGTAILGGTILNMTYSGTYGKFVTSGLGLIEMEGLTLVDNSGSSTPFVYTTNTTLHIHDCGFVGSKIGTACNQDATILGGDTQVEGFGGLNDGFQGYGTVIKDNYYSGIRRIVYGRTFANATVIKANTVWTTCGSNLVDGAAIEFDNVAVGATQYCTGNVITENLIELPNYSYGIRMGRAASNTISHNNMFDATANTKGGVYLAPGATQNIVIDGYTPGTKPALVDSSGLENTHISINDQEQTKFSEPVYLSNTSPGTLIANADFVGPVNPAKEGIININPLGVIPANGKIISLKRSAAETVDPSANIYFMKYNGEQVFGQPSGGNVYGLYQTITGGGRTWSSAGSLAGQEGGGEIKINTGTGGSYLRLQNYGVKFEDHNGGALRAMIGGGADQIRLGSNATINLNAGLIAGTGTPEGQITAPIGSIFMRRDGGANTSMYVKESGTGNTGWIAK